MNRVIRSISLLILCVPLMAQAPKQAPAAPQTREEREQFLLGATILSDLAGAVPAKQSRRITLESGTYKHDASVQTATSADLSQPDYRRHVGAYEVDKLLDLDLVAPSVARAVNGHPGSITWWVDDYLMDELTRRKKKIAPPDPARWNQQFMAMRVFDELIANAYRKMAPDFYFSTLWDNLLITSEWRIWLIDHTRTFQPTHQLEHPESLTQCPRLLLSKLRSLNRDLFEQALGKYLNAPQIEALDVRRQLLVRHFDERIAKYGEGAVLYDRHPD